MIFKNLLEQIDNISLGRFTILVGNSQKGITRIAYHLANKISEDVIVCGNGVDEVRKIIEMSYKRTSPTVYMFLTGGDMSSFAKNALLKITEEPPQKSYFILGFSSIQSVLETLKSRARVISIPDLTPVEVREYVLEIQKNKKCSDFEIVQRYCHTMEQVDKLLSTDIHSFLSFVDKVVENLPDVTVTNALKIANNIAFKNEPEKYDLSIFLDVYFNYLTEKYFDGIIDSSQFKAARSSIMDTKKSLSMPVFNKQYLFTTWLMQQWEILGGEKIE